MPVPDSMPALADGRLAPGVVLAGGLLIALATLTGAWLARRHAARRELCFGAAAGALLVISGLHLLPDAWAGAAEAGLSGWLIPVVALGSFGLARLAGRVGCACAADRESSGGAGTAAALAVHRLLEGAAIVLASSVIVTIALVAHALAEGLAAGTLLGSAGRRRRALWLAAMCASPLAGAAVAEAWSFPATAEPVLLAVAAGVLAQAALVSLAAAFRQVRPARIMLSRPAAATILAAAVTVLAVRGAG
jgi:zinc transporter ZupT